jgi:hypothetical protein
MMVQQTRIQPKNKPPVTIIPHLQQHQATGTVTRFFSSFRKINFRQYNVWLGSSWISLRKTSFSTFYHCIVFLQLKGRLEKLVVHLSSSAQRIAITSVRLGGHPGGFFNRLGCFYIENTQINDAQTFARKRILNGNG